jgi:NADPH:quinone reductase-like Zn-dependent oxidoreductase
VWGGASAVGQFAIQLATLSGLRVITTASPANFDLVKGLGAVATYDYHDEDVSSKIQQEWGPDVAVDCVSSTDDAFKVVCDSMGERGGHIALVRPATSSRNDVTASFELVYTLLGKVRCCTDSLLDILRD